MPRLAPVEASVDAVRVSDPGQDARADELQRAPCQVPGDLLLVVDGDVPGQPTVTAQRELIVEPPGARGPTVPHGDAGSAVDTDLLQSADGEWNARLEPPASIPRELRKVGASAIP